MVTQIPKCIIHLPPARVLGKNKMSNYPKLKAEKEDNESRTKQHLDQCNIIMLILTENLILNVTPAQNLKIKPVDQ